MSQNEIALQSVVVSKELSSNLSQLIVRIDVRKEIKKYKSFLVHAFSSV